MTQLTENIFAIEVPGDATKLSVANFYGWDLQYRSNGKVENIDLPSGNWQYLCTSTEITEEQAMDIVRIREANGYPIGYKDYQNDDESYRNAIDSFHSLLRSKSLGRVAIIKKV